MRMTTVLNKVLAIQGLWVRGLQLIAEAGKLWLVVAPRWRISRCGACGRKVWRRHDRTWRSWRHLDCLGQRTYLRYAIWRVRCRRCGPVVRSKRVLLYDYSWSPDGREIALYTLTYERLVDPRHSIEILRLNDAF